MEQCLPALGLKIVRMYQLMRGSTASAEISDMRTWIPSIIPVHGHGIGQTHHMSPDLLKSQSVQRDQWQCLEKSITLSI
jgi:hypothetical protein